MAVTKSTVGPDPTNLCWRAMRLAAILGCFFFSVLLSPLLLLIYSFFALRARITSCVLARHGLAFVGGADSMAGQESNAVIHVLCTMPTTLRVESLQKATLEKVVMKTKEDGTLMFPNMSRYVTRRAGYMVWKPQKHFRIEEHVMRWKTKRAPRSEEELAHYLSEACNSPMPPHRSNWQMLVLDCDFSRAKVPPSPGSTCYGTKSVVLLRMHHAISDGVALIRLMLEHLSETDASITKLPIKPRAGRPQSCASITAVRMARFAAALLCAPYVQLRQIFVTDHSALHGPKLTGRRLAYWSKPIKLSTIKDIKNATATTVNDVMMTCVAGGLRRFLLGRGLAVPDCIHGIIPVSMNAIDKPLDLRNSLSFVVAALATGEKDSRSRLRTTKVRMDDLKDSPDVIINMWLTRFIYNVLPTGLTDHFQRVTPMSLVVSNLPGPANPAKFCGQQIKCCIPIVPIMGQIGMTVCVLSYCGEFVISVCVDTGLIDKQSGIRELMRGFYDELDDLITNTLM